MTVTTTNPLPRDRSASSGLQVAVIDGADDDLTARLVSGLRARGLDAHRGDIGPGDEVVVVVLPSRWDSLNALLAEVQPDQRLVPVATESVDSATVPAALAQLNWLPWHVNDPDASLDRLAKTCRSTIDEHRTMEMLRARAEGWIFGGRNAADLPTNRRDVAAALSVARTSLVSVPNTVEDYLAAATAAGRKALRNRVLRSCGWGALAVLVAIATVNVVDHVRNARARQQLSYVAMTDSGLSMFPAGNAVQVAAYGYLTEQVGGEVDAQTRESLVELLSQRWPTTRYSTSPTGMHVNAVALSDDVRLLWADGGGDVWTVDGTSLEAVRLAHFSDLPLYHVAADRDWSTIAAVDSAGTLVVRTQDGLTRTDTPGALGVAVEGPLVVAWSQDSIWVAGAAPLQRSVGRVATAGAVDGHILALVSSGGTLELVDCLSGEVVDVVATDLPGPVSKAAISPLGHVVYEGTDGQLWAWSGSGTQARPTGLQLDGHALALALTSRDEVLYSTFSQGTQFYDLADEQRLFDVCGTGTANSFVVSPFESLVACRLGADNQVWSLEDARPAGPGSAAAARPQVRARSADGRTVASLDENGLLDLTVDGHSVRLDPNGTNATTLLGAQHLGGRATTVALGPDHQLALGAANGSVVVYDVAPGPVLGASQRWVAPDRAPVTSVELSAGRLIVVTTTATWNADLCVGCSKSFGTLLAEVQRRALPCYPQYILENVPMRVMDELGLRICRNE